MEILAHARVLVALGELTESERLVEVALESRPDDNDALSLLAKIKHIRGQLSAAVACWAQLAARAPFNERARLHLTSMLHLAQDPERGAGELIALGQGQLVRKPSAYLALEQAFVLFAARQPDQARAHCQHVAARHHGTDRELYKLARLADAWIAEMSGDLEPACTVLEQLGRERGFERDLDRVLALVNLYERIGTPPRLEAAVNICTFLSQAYDALPVIGRLAVLYRRLGRGDDAARAQQEHLTAFRRGMQRPTYQELLQVAAERYLPIPRLRRLAMQPEGEADGPLQRGVALALEDDTQGAHGVLETMSSALAVKYLADLTDLEHGDAVDAYLAALRVDPSDGFVVAWLLDAGQGVASARIGAALQAEDIGEQVEQVLRLQLDREPVSSAAWRRLATFYLLVGREQEHRQAAGRAEVLAQAQARLRGRAGRVLAAAAYHFMGTAKGLVHEVWAERKPTDKGKGGNLPSDALFGNLTTEMRAGVQNAFLAVREYACAKLPHLVGDLFDYDYAYKITKEDEPSGGLSAGLPTAIAFMSVFIQQPVADELCSTGVLVADAHDVLLVRPVGDIEYKVKGAYHRNLARILVPGGNRPQLEQGPLVPQAVCEEIVRYVDDFDSAMRQVFGDRILA